MSFRFKQIRVHNDAVITTATTLTSLGVCVSPVDISDYDRFSVLYQNSNTAIGFLNIVVQGAYDTSGSVANQALNWFDIPTTTLTVPSALGPTATIWAAPVNPNTFHWLRVKAAASATAALGTFSITIAGHMRN